MNQQLPPQHYPTHPGYDNQPPYGAPTLIGAYGPNAHWGQAPQQRTNGFAIASLIAGVFACSPVALPLAIIALFQVKSSGERGRKLAIGGLIASVVWIVITVVALASGNLRFTIYEGPIPNSVIGSPSELRVGECVDHFPALAPGAVSSGAATASSCDEPHDGQVMMFTGLPQVPWPGHDTAVSDARTACDAALRPLLDDLHTDAQLRTAFLTPATATAWNESHRAACLFIRATPQKLTHQIG